MAADEEGMERRRRIRLPLRRPRWAIVLIGFLFVILLLLAIIWTQRRQLATDYIEGELERRGVEATYRVTRIGFRTQRLEDVVIGDPERPDLTARQVEVRVAWSLRGPTLAFVKARGVRLFGRIVDEKVSFGQVDKLLPPPTGKPFEFPDLNVDLADAAVALDTPAGILALGVAGRGNLSDGFRGEMAARSSRLLLGECAIAQPRAYVEVAIDDGRPSIDGPVRAERMVCPGDVDFTAPVLDVDATFAETFNSWRGDARLQVGRAVIEEESAAGVTGSITFDGRRRLTRGRMNLTVVEARVGDFAAARAAVAGRYALSLSGEATVIADVSAQGVTGGTESVRPIAATLASLDGTPLDPIGDSLSGAIQRAMRGFDAVASIRIANGSGFGGVRVERLSAISRSGARIGLTGGEGLNYYWPDGTIRIDGELGLTGGGFPATRLSVNQPYPGAPMRGEARVAPMAAGNARLALAPSRFRAAEGGATRFETAAVLSGPFNDGYVRNLALPIAGTFGNGGFAVGEGCVTATFDSVQAAGLRLGRTRLPLCPTGRALVWKNAGGPVRGGAEIRSARLAGRLGQSPISLATTRVRFDLAEPGFTGSDVAIRLGRTGSVSVLDLDTLSGRFTSRGVTGTFAGAAGQIANVPLLISDGRGEWSVIGGDLVVEGGITVADAADPPRFWPLRSDDFRLTLIDGVIDAGGWLHDPETGTPVTQAIVRHVLDTGAGNAVLDVPGITFTVGGYQPDDLTRLTTGVVALVDGTLVGRGQINWNEAGTTSTGTFSTTGMDLAAPFGPVEGLTTTINFTDLLGLTSAPGQVATVDLIRPGIDVENGTIRYQLLPDLRVRVESGHWPFMGGDLTLDDTILDFSQESEKRLTFYVRGLDAATFIERMEFSNIAATGTFDGVIPMIFDQSGGQVVGGRLEARPPGGTLSYIGEVSEAALGTYGKIAFDALKSLRYDKFIINLNGSLAGEFLAGIELDGIARNTGEQGGILGFVLNQLRDLKFEFNINIRGPFRALIATARSFEDPGLVIQPVLPPELQGLPIDVIEQDRDESETVQPQESENMP